MKRKIPEKTYIRCDFCAADTDLKPFKMECEVRVKGHCLDNLGDRACAMDIFYDLCDDCAQKTVQSLAASANHRIG